MRRWLLFALLPACAYRPDGAGRAPEPPEDVTMVALATLDSEGDVEAASALFEREDAHPFSGPIAARADGVRERLIGFTDAQLDACHRVVEVAREDDDLAVAQSPIARLPAPVWAAEGTWSDGAIDFTETTDDTAYALRSIGHDFDACQSLSMNTRALTTTSTESVRFTLQPPNRPPLLFTGRGEVYELDVESLEITLSTTSSIPYVGGHVDDAGTIWVMRRNGCIGTLDSEGRFARVACGGPFVGGRRIWVDGVGETDSLDLYTVTASAAIYRFHEGAWTLLFQGGVIPSIGRVLSADVYFARDEGVAYVAMDGMAAVYRIRGDEVSAAEIGEGPLGSPIGFLVTRRYGFMATTKSGGLVRQVSHDAWEEVQSADEGRRSPYIFDFDYGILHGGSNSLFRYFVEGLPTCRFQRFGDGEVFDVFRTGDALILIQNADPVEIVRVDVAVSPIGCDVGVE